MISMVINSAVFNNKFLHPKGGDNTQLNIKTEKDS